MHPPTHMDKPSDRLDSWKAIAEYLGRDRTTVMRWERSAGLPVRRVQGGAGRSVFAYTEELDRWLAGDTAASSTIPESTPSSAEGSAPSRTFPWGAAAAIGFMLAAATGVWWLSQSSGEVAKARIVGEELVAEDAGGEEVWRHRFAHIDGNIVLSRMVVADIDGDDEAEALAAVHFMKRGGDAYGAVLAFAQDGALRWQRSLQDRYTFGGDEYGPSWFPEDMLVYRSGTSIRIAVAEHHHTWWPGIVVIYGSNGEPIDRFVNSGWIRSLNITADGRYLLAAGISNAFSGAALAVLDATKPGGASPADEGSLPGCLNCPGGHPVAYFVAPWSEVARPSDTPNVVVYVNRDGVQWHAMQRAVENGKAPEVIVGLSPTLAFVRQDENVYFHEIRRSLGEPGPDSERPTRGLREWTPARGWRRVNAE